MEAYTSEELFHFVGFSSPQDDASNYEKLSTVLNDGWISYFPHQKSWGQPSYKVEWPEQLHTEKLIVPDVTCYADIPVNCLSIHVAKYGKFGIGIARSYLIKYGARPVMYLPMCADDWQSIHGQALLNDIEIIVKSFNEQVIRSYPAKLNTVREVGSPLTSPEAAALAMKSMVFKDFLAFLKPFNSELDSLDPNNFYMEREWRRLGNVEIKAEQVTKIVVAKGYKERVASDFPKYSKLIVEI
jgi:hypothetical protein